MQQIVSKPMGGLSSRRAAVNAVPVPMRTQQRTTALLVRCSSVVGRRSSASAVGEQQQLEQQQHNQQQQQRPLLQAAAVTAAAALPLQLLAGARDAVAAAVDGFVDAEQPAYAYPAADDPVVTLLFTAAIGLLSVVTLGVIYLGVLSWNDGRQEKADREGKSTPFGTALSASPSSAADK